MMPVWAKTAHWDCCQPFCDDWFAEFVFCARAKKEHVALKTLLKFFSSRLSHLIQMHMVHRGHWVTKLPHTNVALTKEVHTDVDTVISSLVASVFNWQQEGNDFRQQQIH